MRSGLGPAMRARRKALGISMREASQRAGYARGGSAWWSRIELGQRDCSLRVFERIALGLRLSPVQLAQNAAYYSSTEEV